MRLLSGRRGGLLHEGLLREELFHGGLLRGGLLHGGLMWGGQEWVIGYMRLWPHCLFCGTFMYVVHVQHQRYSLTVIRRAEPAFCTVLQVNRLFLTPLASGCFQATYF